MPRKPRSRQHLVTIANYRYDAEHYNSLIQHDPATGCEIIPNIRSQKMVVWNIDHDAWRTTTPLSIAARLKMGEGPGKRRMTHSCGNSDCVNLQHIDWRPVDTSRRKYPRYNIVRNKANPQITREHINPAVIEEKQQIFDEFTDWWRDYSGDPTFKLPQWITIEESYRIIIRTRPGKGQDNDMDTSDRE